MSLLSQAFGVAFNLLLTPIINTVDVTLDNTLRFGQESQYSPLNFLKSSGLASCKVTFLNIGDNQLKFSVLPRGYCQNCCPINVDRDIRFVLYNRTNPYKGAVIEPHNKAGAAKLAGVDSGLKTIIYIHGFTEISPGESGKAVIDAYLTKNESYNIILLDWTDLATLPWYKPAVDNVKLVAKILREFLEVFNDSGEIPIGQLHIVGFSLGSHIAAQAGKQLRRDIRIPRITALDPAFPEFSLKDTSRRLAHTDAEYIDVIHTDAGVLGFPTPLGHADFYPNGGKALQPGCQPSYLVQARVVDQFLACSHVRAWRLYAESVKNPKGFPATKCKAWRGQNKECNFTLDGYMGYGNNNNSHGQFYLITNFRKPFSRSVKRQVQN